MSHHSIHHPRPVWTPADAEQLRRDIAAEPHVLGHSVVLELIMQSEGL